MVQDGDLPEESSMRLKNQNKLIPQGFDFQQNPIPLRSFILILAAIFLVEAVIMQVLLVVVILPVLYFTFLRPMMTQYQDAVNAREAAETLWRSSMDLARTMELEKVYQIMLDQVARLAPYDIATLCLLTSPSRLDVETVRNTLTGNEAKIPAHLSIHPEDYPLLSQVIREEKSKVVADVSAEKGWVERPYLPAMRSWIGIPLVVGGKVVGLCELGRREANFYTRNHLRMAEALVELAAVAIQNAWLFEQVLSGRERLVDLTHQLVDVQENERRYIARELHDEVGQVVVTMMVHLNLLEQKAGDPEEVRRIADDMQVSLSSVSNMLHELAANLRPASLDHLGWAAKGIGQRIGDMLQDQARTAELRQFLDQVNEKHGLKINLDYDVASERLSADLEISLFRILQESVNNILKHAQATQIDVMLKPRGDQLILMVEDDGVGFDPEEARRTKRLGLFGIRERAQAIGGDLVIESAPGKGTTILVEVPYG